MVRNNFQKNNKKYGGKSVGGKQTKKDISKKAKAARNKYIKRLILSNDATKLAENIDIIDDDPVIDAGETTQGDI